MTGRELQRYYSTGLNESTILAQLTSSGMEWRPSVNLDCHVVGSKRGGWTDKLHSHLIRLIPRLFLGGRGDRERNLAMIMTLCLNVV